MKTIIKSVFKSYSGVSSYAPKANTSINSDSNSKLLWHTQELARMSQGQIRVLIPSRLPKETSLGRMIPKHVRNHALALSRAGTELNSLKNKDYMW
jgi:hypothetical protein